MKRKKNLLIATSNEEDAAGLAQIFSNLEEIRLLPPADNGNEVINALLAHDTDLLLLDLLLSGVDGVSVLDFIDRISPERRPTVFAMSAVGDDRLIRSVKDRVIYCFIKPLFYEVVQMRVLSLMRACEKEPLPPVGHNGGMEILETQIAAGIRAIGVPAHLKGYYYLRDAIRIYALSESPVKLCVTQDVYPVVARIYNTRASLVEHAIRNAIEIAWTRGNLDTIDAYFGYTVNDFKGKPSNLEFIAMMAERALTYVPKK